MIAKVLIEVTVILIALLVVLSEIISIFFLP